MPHVWEFILWARGYPVAFKLVSVPFGLGGAYNYAFSRIFQSICPETIIYKCITLGRYF